LRLLLEAREIVVVIVLWHGSALAVFRLMARR
jgi:hypothetical protein